MTEIKPTSYNNVRHSTDKKSLCPTKKDIFEQY